MGTTHVPDARGDQKVALDPQGLELGTAVSHRVGVGSRFASSERAIRALSHQCHLSPHVSLFVGQDVLMKPGRHGPSSLKYRSSLKDKSSPAREQFLCLRTAMP